MKRVTTYLTVLFGFGGMMALAAAQGPGAVPAAPPAAPGAAQYSQSARPTIAVFNMAAVMKDYGKAKYQVYLLTEERKKLSADLTGMKGDYVKLQQDIQIQRDAGIKDAMQKQMVELGRRLEDKTREIDKVLNDKASNVISSLYDEIKSVVDKTAEMNGYLIVFAYPDATGADEKSPYVKELKLKPPAAQPFYVSKQVDITQVVITALNTWYPAPPVPQTAPAANPAPTTPQPVGVQPGLPPLNNPSPTPAPGVPR